MADPETTLLGRGIYSIADAARLTRIPRASLRRWMTGYEFEKKDGSVVFSPQVIRGELPIVADTLALSFLDLMEARALHAFRLRRVSWGALRDAHEKARDTLETDHPFSTGQFKTVGRVIMRDFADETGDLVLMDLAKNQTSFREFLKPYLRGLDFLPDSNFPARWFPVSSSKRVVIDPRRSFGRPVVTKRGVLTSILAQAHKAEGSFEKVARWYEVDVRSVKDAVEYERALAA